MTSKENRPPVSVLLVEDEESHRADWVEKIEKQFPTEVEIREADSFDGVVEAWEDGFHPDIAVIDHRLRASETVEAANGDHVVRWLRERCPKVRILVTTGFSMERHKGGRVYEAYQEISPDILIFEKDSNWVEDVFPVLERLVNEVRGLLPEVVRILQSELVATSSAMKAFVRAIAPHARRHRPLLLLGETGVGKGFVAEAINRASAPSGTDAPPFFKVTCTAVHENLAESELFGHAKGAFTGATRDRAGYFEEAGEGTIFLDEIGDISPIFQAKLLEVLQTGQYRRLGETRPRTTNARVIAATNADLRKKIDEGTFREDLYYRLSVAEFHLPPLRERREDIVPLATLYLKQKYPGFVLSRASKDVLQRSNWPGNIRQLENRIDGAVASSESKQLGPHLFLAGRSAANPGDAGGSTVAHGSSNGQPGAVGEQFSDLDFGRLHKLVQRIWKDTQSTGAVYTPRDLIADDEGGVLYMRAVLGVFRYGLEQKYGYKNRRAAMDVFNRIFGFRRDSYELTHLFQDPSQDTRKAYGAELGAATVKRDGEKLLRLLTEKGYSVSFE